MKMFSFTLLVVCIILGLGRSELQREQRNTLIDKGSHYLLCEQEPIELGIVLDSSSSIRREDFKKGKIFLKEFLDQFDIGDGENDVRVSIITFGRGIYPKDGFDLTTYTNKEDLLEAIGNVPHRAGPYTDTGKGIKYMHTHQLARDIVRPAAEKVGLVITDGNSQDWNYTKTAAAAARADGISMFAVGIGSRRTVKERELLNIAGDASRVTRVENYSSLTTVKELLAKKTCIKKIKTTTMPPMKMQTCGEADPADINFVFSPGDLGIDAVAWTTSFISNTVSNDKMDKGFRYGVLSGFCPMDSGFALDDYDNVTDIRERLMTYDEFRLPALTKYLSEKGFSEEKGGREEARKVAVLFAKGSKGIKGGDLEGRVHELTEKGVRVFIANPAGYPIKVDDAYPLRGRSSRQQSEELISLLCPTAYF